MQELSADVRAMENTQEKAKCCMLCLHSAPVWDASGVYCGLHDADVESEDSCPQFVWDEGLDRPLFPFLDEGGQGSGLEPMPHRQSRASRGLSRRRKQ